jgi:hypothetical protein
METRMGRQEQLDRQAFQQRLIRRARVRAAADTVVLALAVTLAALFGESAHEALLLALLASSAGILIFLLRRGRDLGALARADRWRADAVEGRGLGIAAWRAGDPLPSWDARRNVA